MRHFALAAVLMGAGFSYSAPHSFQGNFVNDDDLAVFILNLESDAIIDARTYGWGGGINFSGQSMASGGFAPVLSLIDETGLLIQLAVGSSQICGPGSGVPSSALGSCWDAVMTVDLAAGRYLLIESQDGNLPFGPTLADGFSRSGQPTFTGSEYLGDSSRRFINVDGSPRENQWSLSIAGSGLTVAQVPEPTPATTLLAGLAIIFVSRRFRRAT